MGYKQCARDGCEVHFPVKDYGAIKQRFCSTTCHRIYNKAQMTEVYRLAKLAKEAGLG